MPFGLPIMGKLRSGGEERLERSGDLGVSGLSFDSNTGDDLDRLRILGLASGWDCLQFGEEEGREYVWDEEGERCVRW
jgi:hypothetical protein